MGWRQQEDPVRHDGCAIGSNSGAVCATGGFMAVGASRRRFHRMIRLVRCIPGAAPRRMDRLENTRWQSTTDEAESCSAWSWIPRGLVTLWLGWALIQSIGSSHRATLFSGIDLGIHEAG